MRRWLSLLLAPMLVIALVLSLSTPASAAAKKGTLSASSSPGGATVMLNGTSYGVTPLNIQLESGTYSLVLRLTGYQDYSQQVSITPGKTTTVAATLTPDTSPPSATRLLKYITAYGVEEWTEPILSDLGHFDMAAIDVPPYDNAADPGPVRARYSHDQLKLLGYLDVGEQVYGLGYTDVDPNSEKYWGNYILATYAGWQEAYGGALDGLFLDNCYAGAFGYPTKPQDFYTLGDWLRGQVSLDGTRQIPIVLMCGGDPLLAQHADIWMSEDFGSAQRQLDYVNSVTAAGGTAVTLNRSVADTQAMCLWNLACFLCAYNSNGKAYFSFQDIWRPSMGYYPMMDVDYGSPIGSTYLQNGSILTREYTKCTVTVNMKKKTGQISMK
jgi:hypothetical protein